MSFRWMPILVFACLTLLPGPARAQGHMVHGVGPVNSAMGGAGAALPQESLTALTFNPALISDVQGNQISFTSEFFKDGINIRTTVNALVGETRPSNQLGVLPAFGWMLRDPSKKLAMGFGLIGLAGFRTDYPSDNASVLFSQPPSGFGRIFTDYRVTKIPVAVAFELTPKLSVGASVNVYMAELAIAPLPYKVFDVDAAGNRYYPEGGSLNTRWTVAGQFGFLFKVHPMLNIGAAVTTPQKFSPYKWNSTMVNPASSQYGLPRTLEYDLDGPLSVNFGAGIMPGSKTKIAVDGMYTRYKGVEGFGSPGGIINGIVYPFGWRDVWTFKAGVQQQVSKKLVVRGGYNFSQTPLRSEVILTATGAPATFQNHYCGGIGFQMFPFLEAEASVYVVPREHVIGPFPNLQNQVIGSLDESNRLTSALVGLNFRF